MTILGFTIILQFSDFYSSAVWGRRYSQAGIWTNLVHLQQLVIKSFLSKGTFILFCEVQIHTALWGAILFQVLKFKIHLFSPVIPLLGLHIGKNTRTYVIKYTQAFFIFSPQKLKKIHMNVFCMNRKTIT